MERFLLFIIPQGGKHCITNSLKQIFSYYGYLLSEEMMFGLASGNKAKEIAISILNSEV